MTRILIADDHTMFRAGLNRLLEQESEFEVVAEASSGIEAVSLAGQHRPGIVLLDISLPDIDGFEVARRLRDACPAARIIILTMHDNDEYAAMLLQMGIHGYLLKGNSPLELVQAIKKVAAGGRYVTASIEEKLSLQKSADASHEPARLLSRRELQIFSMLAQGNTSKQICADLNLKPSTVGTHKKRIMEKLRTNNMSDLILLALNTGFIRKK